MRIADCGFFIRPVRSFINPAPQQFDLLRLQRLAAQGHTLFAAFAQHARQQTRRFAIARHNHRAGDAAFHCRLSAVQPQLSRRLLSAVALHTRSSKDRLDVAFEINLLCLIECCHALAQLRPHNVAKRSEEERADDGLEYSVHKRPAH
ncbi:MAG TPA: hypothetical protein VFD58_14885 [Blastocatellia bacterium]|nr:hypothetical protein [Blastocatellia bacterium]